MDKEIDLLINKPIESDLSNWYINDIQLMKGYLVFLQDQLEEKTKIIEFLEDKIKEYEFNDKLSYKKIEIRASVRNAYQEILDYVKGDTK